MRADGKRIMMGLLVLTLFWPVWESQGQERFTDTGRDRWQQPLEPEDMGPYEDVVFEPAAFDRIERGMTEEDVLALLGKPVDFKKVHRRGNRWSVHYYYPAGRVVNFRDGLVVGTEKP